LNIDNKIDFLIINIPFLIKTLHALDYGLSKQSLVINHSVFFSIREPFLSTFQVLFSTIGDLFSTLPDLFSTSELPVIPANQPAHQKPALRHFFHKQYTKQAHV
jgi:hypothetical protein